MQENYTAPPLKVDLDNYIDVDWGRLASPQADGYDASIFARLANERYGWTKQDPPVDALGTFAKGAVEIIGEFQSPREGWAPLPIEDLRWKWVDELCEQAWPEQYLNFQLLTNRIASYHEIDNPHPGCGCSCGPVRLGGNPFLPDDPVTDWDWGNVWASFTSNVGWLEGVQHELFHWKGYAMGVYIEDWEHMIFQNTPPKKEWIENAPCPKDLSTEDHNMWVERGLGFQPLRIDKLRPIGALFQEIWCCVGMIDLHIRTLPFIEKGYPGDTTPENFIDWARSHLVRTNRGHHDMLKIAELVPGVGEQFWHGYCSWYDKLYDEAWRMFDLKNYEDTSEYQWRY